MTASDSDRLTGEIGEWLTARFPTLSVPELPVRGTYGLVWLAPNADGSPGGVALKTIDPSRIRDKTGRHAYADFERELHVWLRVPMHQNVVPALGIEHAELTAIPDPRWQLVPIARMPLYACSLRQWVNAAECPAVCRFRKLCGVHSGNSAVSGCILIVVAADVSSDVLRSHRGAVEA